MSDPLSITASIAGITVAALHGTRLLLEDLQQLKDAPKTVKRLMEEVHSVDTALKLVQGVEDREWELLGTLRRWEIGVERSRKCGILEAVKVSQKLLNKLLSKSQEEAVAKAAGNLSPSTTVTFSGQNSGFQAGSINGGVSGISFGGK
ncbi:hypothetical protein V492_00350 [Pseudogymnoascus sp. VKM F-4246]|nr:hypothetical protein V492_00350 [Pseudogymnoascus sp. VKM F-4246]